MKTAILGIGTELTDGQIINKNAAWLSSHLKEYGVLTTHHLVVPDDRLLIREALDFCAGKCDVLFVTGGLGPTSDDFTRDLISEWADLPLEWHEASWQHVNTRLTSRGYTVKEIQRQQCYFPRGSRVLFNSQGTANAFYLEAKGKKVFVLPGPPREIEAVWNSDIEAWLVENTADLDPRITRSWDTMGVGESDIATIVEDVLKDVDVEKGYRVHLPYVEVKMSFLASEEDDFEPYVEKITEALQFCLVTRDAETVPEMLAEILSETSSISIQDEVTGSFLINRVLPTFREILNNTAWSFSNIADYEDESEVVLRILPVDEHHVKIETVKGQQIHWDIIPSPYKTANMAERRLQYFAEMAMVNWVRMLR
ncbi:competence/damage-inducible protein A [Bdellovibrio sp. HCB2-146]|uniref:competence/damage-inducible protein A n=1 Tax=Bdellovibrio sp. HCB2-146 TaxID=3394362 RepID=UPI0039BCD173